MQFSF
jgi:hypothetical protein